MFTKILVVSLLRKSIVNSERRLVRTFLTRQCHNNNLSIRNEFKEKSVVLLNLNPKRGQSSTPLPPKKRSLIVTQFNFYFFLIKIFSLKDLNTFKKYLAFILEISSCGIYIRRRSFNFFG